MVFCAALLKKLRVIPLHHGGHSVADGAIIHSVSAYLPSPSIKLASIAKSVLFLAFGDNLSQLIVIPSGQAHGLLRGTVLLVAG